MGKLLEKLADSEHERWSRWMRWSLANWTKKNTDRWKRQMETPYNELTEEEKDKDREEAIRTIEIFKGHLDG